MNWFLCWKCGPWKGHHEILEAQVWEFEYELDYKRKERSYMGLKLWFEFVSLGKDITGYLESQKENFEIRYKG